MVMRSTGPFAAAALLVAASLAACSEEPPPANMQESGNDGRVGNQVEGDPDAAAPDDVGDATFSPVECCPPSPQPNCCMDYGGAKVDGNCRSLCDGMPRPADPAWRLVNDKYGCPRWSSVGSTGPCCGGEPVPDGGVRAFSCYGDNGEPPRALEPRAAAVSLAESIRDCTSDADCCVVYDSCRPQGLVVAIAGRGSVRALLDEAPNDKCFACIPPRVQVACVAGKCVGAKASSDAGVVVGPEKDHCGTLGVHPAASWQQMPLGCGPS